jgi:hypothetical protein
MYPHRSVLTSTKDLKSINHKIRTRIESAFSDNRPAILSINCSIFVLTIKIFTYSNMFWKVFVIFYLKSLYYQFPCSVDVMVVSLFSCIRITMEGFIHVEAC